jgi:serine/threonine protein phosphatase PrpC
MSYVCLANRSGIVLKLTKTFPQANAGDSRGVLGIKGRAKPLSNDHKPQLESLYTRSISI